MRKLILEEGRKLSHPTQLVGAHALLYIHHWLGHCPNNFMCSPSLRLHHNPNEAATIITLPVCMSTLGPEEVSNLAGITLPHPQGRFYYTSLFHVKIKPSALLLWWRPWAYHSPHTAIHFLIRNDSFLNYSLLRPPCIFPEILVYTSFLQKKLSTNCCGAGLSGPCASWDALCWWHLHRQQLDDH